MASPLLLSSLMMTLLLIQVHGFSVVEKNALNSLSIHEKKLISTYLGDTCDYVYYDFGSNIGIQVRKLFEPAKFKGAPVLKVFDQYFGVSPPRNKKVCAIGAEPNPNHWPVLGKIQTAYNKLGWRTLFFARAVGATNSGEITFYTDNAMAHKEWGFSIIDITGRNATVKVKTMNLPSLVHYIAHQYRPAKTVMKFDVEGTEFKLIPAMILTGTFCYLDVLFAEWHNKFLTKKEKSANFQKVPEVLNQLVHLVKESSPQPRDYNCSLPKITDLDDETFKNKEWDGGPTGLVKGQTL